MKKQVIYLATLAALTAGGSAVVHQINPSFIGTKIAYAGVPERDMLVYPIDQRYITFNSSSGGADLTAEGEQLYNYDGLDGLQRFTVRSSAPYLVKTYGGNIPSSDSKYDEEDSSTDPSYLWTIYVNSFSPKDPNSGLKTIYVPTVYFDDDAGQMSDFYSKYVNNDATYTISDLRNTLSSMDDTSFNNFGFGDRYPQYGSRTKLIKAIDTVLSSYNAVSAAAAGSDVAATSSASSSTSSVASSSNLVSSSVANSVSYTSSYSVTSTDNSSYASSTSTSAISSSTTSTSNVATITSSSDSTNTSASNANNNTTTSNNSSYSSDNSSTSNQATKNKDKIKRAKRVVKHDQRKLNHAERKLKHATKKSKHFKKLAKEAVQKAKKELSAAKRNLIKLEK